jgi:hypothetical protein
VKKKLKTHWTRPIPCSICQAEGFVWTLVEKKDRLIPAMRDDEGLWVPDHTQPLHEPCRPERRRKVREPKPGMPGNGDLAKALAGAVQPYLDLINTAPAAIDETKVRAIVSDEIDKAKTQPRRLEILIRRESEPNAAPKSMGIVHHQFQELLFAAQVARNQSNASHATKWPLLVGPAGGGKSHATHQVADALGIKFFFYALTPALPDSRLWGYMDANSKYSGTVLRYAYEHGHAVCLDELDNSNDATMSGLNSLLANGEASFPDGMVKKHPNFLMVGTANTLRGGSRKHMGRRELDGATIDRFAILRWRYDDSVEDSRVDAVLSGESGRAWVNWIRAVRAYADAHVPQLIVSQRASYAGAVALAQGLPAGLSLRWLADAYVFAGVDDQTADSIIAACPLPALKVAA